ncbi:MAG: acetyl-CoA carboxylase biotin carboxyl carrier protein subunit [Candidatus Nealsonbacteria bacterium]|nr:MAG: acetyl-CoA carboxylase biotin carboxyl carrier protein subunit [Candidatus Nealsonbacteria bacterium]
MNLKINIQGKEYDVEIKRLNKDKVKIKVGKEEFIFEEKEKEKEKIVVAKTALPKRKFKTKEIKAPIAGTVSEVFVKENEFIKKGRKVVLLSAMKMENEIISEFEGRVKKILAKKEQKVKEGKVLIILE